MYAIRSYYVEALLAVADRETSLIVSGTGDVIEPEDGLVAIGSGGMYALSAARALLAHTDLDARGIATEALNIAGDICIYRITSYNVCYTKLLRVRLGKISWCVDEVTHIIFLFHIVLQ